MRIRVMFIILVVLFLALGGVLILENVHRTLPHLYLIEGLIALILIYLLFFYWRLIKPLNIIGSGMELLREQDFSSRLRTVGQFEADRIVNVFNRMMEQLKNERLRLREQNHFLDLLIQASPMGVIILSLDNRVSQVNSMGLKILGGDFDAINGRELSELQTPLAADLATFALDETRVIRLNDGNVYKCTYSFFIDHGFKHPFFLVERMTEEVMRVEKKAYEKVIRMIAHEVNNTTAGITSALDTVNQALSEDEGNSDFCEVMKVCIERCYSMSHFITRFADVVKIPEPTLTSVSLNELADTCRRFMESMCNEHDIVLKLECDPGVNQVRVDVALFEQVLVNIIKNAIESIGQHGEIVIRTLAPATLDVIDNGPGIPREVESKLFSPFFSTKPKGQGIGLIFIREVLTRHRCNFSLHTGADHLTCFHIQFP